MALRAAFIPIALAVPALLAPPLVRFGPNWPVPLRRSLAFIVCLVPSTAPLACDSANHPGMTFLIAILGVIVTLKAIDWLSNPRHEDQPLRVRLALTFWPLMVIGGGFCMNARMPGTPIVFGRSCSMISSTECCRCSSGFMCAKITPEFMPCIPGTNTPTSEISG